MISGEFFITMSRIKSPSQKSIVRWSNCTVQHLGQRIADKFAKLSKIGFSMECFETDFSKFWVADDKVSL